MLHLRVLGTPALESDGSPVGAVAAQRKSLALLALLARAGPAGASRDKLMAYLWPEADGERAAHRLTQLVYSLRRSLGAESVFLGVAELRLNPTLISTDIAEFTDALDRGDAAAAVATYQGPFLDGFFIDGAPEFERWAEAERGDCARRLRAALESLAQTAARRGELSAAADWWQRLAQLDPLNARVTVACMEAAAATGDRAGALQLARTHERLMRDELDAPAERAVLEAAERIRASSACPPAAAPKAAGPSVAVLPFVNMSPEQENEYFSDGMTEELTNVLSQVPGLRVASRTSAFTFKGKSVAATEIGDRLKVGALVEGSVRKVGDRIRVTAQLVDTATGYQRWSETYDRKLENVFALQEELARAIVSALPLGLAGLVTPTVRPSTSVLDAYTYYLRGRFHSLKRSVAGLTLGIEYLEQATELDPEYALAHAGLAEGWSLRGFEEFGDLPPLVAMPRAKLAVARALELDDRLAEGYAWRGVIAFLFDWDWNRSEADFLRAIELRPDYSLAHTWYAVFLAAMTRKEEALARIRHAVELDPLSLPVQGASGNVLYRCRHYDEALTRLTSVLELEPDNPRAHVWRVRTYIASQRFEEALSAVQRTAEQLGRYPMLLEQLGRALALLGRREEAEAVIAELHERGTRERVSPWHEGSILFALGRLDDWFRLMDLLVRQRSGRLAFFRAEPMYDAVRGDPRFLALFRRAGLAG
ncbi:MAG: tetratricopeptide repeat protein [Gemmatimonadales bacterium]|nr:tetratricopeptide repeat protein [Gemmatimonadales bacterium]